jgi:8-oxo-dGTP pyrophosphatase MutT (NUDIX family)
MPHIHEKIDFVSETFVVYKDKVLLRKHDKYNIWLSVGGHIELDEDPVEAAIREVKEEVGLDIEIIANSGEYIPSLNEDYREIKLPVSICRLRMSPTHEHICFVFFAKSNTDAVIPEKPTDEWRWCNLNEIENISPINDNTKFYAKLALQKIR